MHTPSRLTPLSKALLTRQMFRPRPVLTAMGLACCLPLTAQAQDTPPDVQAQPLGSALSQQQAAINLAPTSIESRLLGLNTDGTGSYTTGAVSIGKGAPQSLRETPQSVTVVTRQVMDDRNLTSLSEVLEDTPGMSFQYRNFGGHVYTSRGFSLLAESFLVDGMGGQGYQITGWMQPDMAIYDRVEVLRGASGLLVGAGQPGGAVNLVRKRPTAENRFSITTRAGSWDQYRMDLDASGRLNEAGTVRGRMVAAYDDSGSYLDGRDSRTPLLYGIVDFDLSDATTLTMSLRRQEQEINGYSIYALPRYSNGQDLHLSRSTNLAPKWNQLESDMTEVFTEVAHRFNDDWTSRTSLTYSEGGFDQRIAYARGAISPVTQTGSAFQQTLFRRDEVQSTGFNSQLEGNFDAFGLSHQVTFGADWSKQESNTRQATARSARFPIDVFNFDRNAYPKPARPAWTTDTDMTEERAGLYANTRLHLSEPLSLVLGARLSWYDYQYDALPGAVSYHSQETREFTPFAGLIYDINDNWSWYASYADIFTPQAEYVTASGSPLDAATGINYETGFKGELFDKRLNLSMAMFYIKQKDVAAVDLAAADAGIECGQSLDLSCYIQGDVKRSKGFEVEASGEVLPGLQVFGGYTYNMLTASGDLDVAYETPKHMLRLSSSYNLPGAWNRLTVGAGVSADSGYKVPFDDNLGVSGRAIWDARASWKLDEHWRVSVNAENLFDRKYYVTSVANDRSNLYGEPRSYVLTLRGDF